MFKGVKDGLLFSFEDHAGKKNQGKIPSKLYPLSHKSKMNVFQRDNTEPLDVEVLKNEIDKEQFERGFCYTNTLKVNEIGQRLGLPIKYYSGWLFIGTDLPVFHSWAVLGNSVIDVSYNPLEVTLFEERVKPGHPDPRKEFAKILVEIDRDYKPSEKSLIGKVPEGVLYVGCPDTIDNARLLYESLVNKYPNHPSFPTTGAYERSPTQQEYDKLTGIRYK